MFSAEYFFDLPPQTRPPTILYSIEPRGICTGDIEALHGYVIRLAAEHRVSASALIRNLLLDAIDALDQGYTARNFRGFVSPTLAGTAIGSLAWATALANLTGREDISRCTLLWARDVIAGQGLIVERRRYCPLCYREHLVAETEPFERLLWQIAIVKACPSHSVKLRDMVCRSSTARDMAFRRTSGSGYCTQCGSLAYQCDPSPPEPASKEDVWIAAQVAELLAYGASGGILVRKDLAQGVNALARELFNGQLAPLSKLSKLSRSLTWSMVHSPHVRVSLPSLVQLCGAASCTLTSLLIGKPVRHSGIPVVRLCNQKRGRIDYDRAMALLKSAVAKGDGSESLDGIARMVGAGSARSIREAFPELSAALISQRRDYMERFVETQKEAVVLECQQVLKQLADRNLTPTLRNAEKLTGTRWSSYSVRAKAFLRLRQRPSQASSEQASLLAD